MTDTASSQWLFTDAELLSSPSILDGLDPAEERCRRAKGVNFILQVGMLLKLPQITLAVASVFFHRFYMRRSLCVEHSPQMALHHYVRPSTQHRTPSSPPPTHALPPPSRFGLPRSKSHSNLKAKDHPLTHESMAQNIAATSLFLATKTEENCRKTKEIVIAVAKVAQKNTSLIVDEQSKEYWRWRDSILLYEELMLELLTFDVVLQSPYNYLYKYIQQVHVDEIKPIRNVAWAFLNDSCMTTLAIQIPSTDIAIAAIYFSVKFHGETIADDENGTPWWTQLGGAPELIVKAVGIMHDFWHDNPLKLADKPYGSAEYASSQEDDVEHTRRRGGSEAGGSSVDAPSETMSQNGNGSVKRKSDGEGEDDEEPPFKKPRRAETPEINDELEVKDELENKDDLEIKDELEIRDDEPADDEGLVGDGDDADSLDEGEEGEVA